MNELNEEKLVEAVDVVKIDDLPAFLKRQEAIDKAPEGEDVKLVQAKEDVN